MTKPSIPKGTRDFSPETMIKRNYIFDTIKSIFNLYGYKPLETPSMENLSTLMGKYGDEGDKLLFKILNSGDFLASTTDEDKSSSIKLMHKISEKGLRYDLTVPFARYVTMYRNDIVFPFKRYQMQPVWRADRPQKGRYREFYQCDVDVIGTTSMLNETELIMMINDVFKALKINIIIKLNNRKILSGIASFIGYSDKLTDITVAIDKMDKIGYDNVIAELKDKGIEDEGINKLTPILTLTGDNRTKLASLKEILKDNEEGLKGIEETETIFSLLEDSPNATAQLDLDLTLARGLNYYTGAIIEVKSADTVIGSICGGGRYDNLTSIFGLPDVSGVGVSFGAERIYDVMNELNLFPEKSTQTTQVLFVNLGDKEARYCLPLISKLRHEGINSELYPDSVKFRKQMEYANKRGIPYVVIAGEDEIAKDCVSVKNMINGEQNTVGKDEILSLLIKNN